MENKYLFNQIIRDVGSLICICDGATLTENSRQQLIKIAKRFDEATPQLQAILYPESLQSFPVDEPENTK